MRHTYSRAMQNFGAQHPSFTPWHNTMRRRVRVYDNGGKTMDRFTVVIYRTSRGATFSDIYGMSENPSDPQGFNQFSHSGSGRIQYGDQDPLFGKRVQVQDLPEAVIKAIESRLAR